MAEFIRHSHSFQCSGAGYQEYDHKPATVDTTHTYQPGKLAPTAIEISCEHLKDGRLCNLGVGLTACPHVRPTVVYQTP